MGSTELASLFLVAMAAACFDAIAGGGGLVTVPVLLLAGLDPVAAIATNKLQAAAGTISAAAAFSRKGLLDWPIALPVAMSAAFGSIMGALSVSLVPTTLLNALVPLILITIAIYFALPKYPSTQDAQTRIPTYVFTWCVAPVIGFYDGVFGPGAGSFYMAGFLSLLSFGVLKATAHTKSANAASNTGSLVLFAVKGSVVWPVGAVMAVGAVLGAQIGSALALRFGPRLIRPLLVSIAIVMAIRLLWSSDNPLRVLIGNGLAHI